jgi:hypothetical protein
MASLKVGNTLPLGKEPESNSSAILKGIVKIIEQSPSY